MQSGILLDRYPCLICFVKNYLKNRGYYDGQKCQPQNKADKKEYTHLCSSRQTGRTSISRFYQAFAAGLGGCVVFAAQFALFPHRLSEPGTPGH
jgi:hypothetical protein